MKIKSKQIELLRVLLVTQMNHWTFFPVYVTCIVTLSDIVGTGTPHILLWLALGSLPLLLYIGRQKLRKFWAFALLHLAVIAFMFLIPAPHISIRIFYILIGIFYVIYSCYINFKSIDKRDCKLSPLIGTGIFLVMLYALHFQGYHNWDTIYVTVLITTLGLYFITYYIEQYQNFLKVNNSSAGHIPSAEMFRSGIGLVLGYTGVGIVILLVISNIEWLRGILTFLKNTLISLLYWFLSLFPKSSDTPAPEGSSEITITTMDGVGMLEADETFWLWNVLEYVLEILFIIGIVFALVKCFIFLVKFIKSKMENLPSKEHSTSDEVVIDIREKCDIAKDNAGKISLPFLHLNPKERIRHMYKKRIFASRSEFPQENEHALNRYTARESGRILKREELAIIYEKARYSDSECDGEDLKRMRNACK